MKFKNFVGLAYILILFLSVVLTGCINQDKVPSSPVYTVEEISLKIMDDFHAKNFSDAFSFFNETLKKMTSVEQVSQIWQSILDSYGSFDRIIRNRTTVESRFTMVYVTCNYSKLGYLDTRFVFDADNLVAGFQFVPTDVSDLYTPPVYANQSLFTEMNVTIGEEPWQLPGTLTIPTTGAGLYPAVVLVQGSGPNDRDETIGPNKPFKDIAWGLASQGIVVLRYEKRTKQYADVLVTMLKNLTVQDETITDAIAAVSYLQSYPGINTSRIYLLGHSLGGYLAPRIASQDSAIAGLIMLAAPARHLEDLILAQVIYLASLDGNITIQEQANIDFIESQVEKIKTLNITSGEMVVGASYAYWADLASYEPIITAESLSVPMLILQGKRDYQVSFVDDFAQWQNAFIDRENVELKTYEDLNHLFIPGTGVPTNTEYNIPGHVDVQVINDIEDWID
jgi:uncharacterized protein